MSALEKISFCGKIEAILKEKGNNYECIYNKVVRKIYILSS